MDDRVKQEKEYWDSCALDPNVDEKYICEAEYFDDCLSYIKDNVSGKVLEIGCGVGRLLIPLSESYDAAGIDISENMLRIAKERSTKPTFKLSDGRSIPFEDGSFDSVYCVAVFQHLNNEGIEQYIEEVGRVLSKNGCVIFQFIEGDESETFSNHYSLDYMELLLRENGMSITKADRGVGHEMWTWVVACK